MAIISSLVLLLTTIEQTYDFMHSLVKETTGKQACILMYLFLSMSILNVCPLGSLTLQGVSCAYLNISFCTKGITFQTITHQTSKGHLDGK